MGADRADCSPAYQVNTGDGRTALLQFKAGVVQRADAALVLLAVQTKFVLDVRGCATVDADTIV